MARKKKAEEHENHERWLVSYADFITLLFAFFVVMYSISSVNEGKYRVLSDSLASAFKPSRDGLPIKLSSPLRPPIIDRDIITMQRQQVNVKNKYPEEAAGPKATLKDKQNLDKVSAEIEKNLKSLIDKDQVKVVKNDLWVEIEIKSNILFTSGSAELSAAAIPVLHQIADILKPTDNQIQVEGFTDNIPIDTDEFPSNWELSAARAASVVHLFSRQGVDPSRLSAVGNGQYKPTASNDTAEGRRKNRRIAVVVLSDAIARTSNRTQTTVKPKTISSSVPEQKTEPVQETDFGAINLLPPARQPVAGGN